MANILATFQRQERLDESELAHQLSIEVTQIPRLALCKRPPLESGGFAEKVKQIAAYVGADPTALAQIIRQVDAIEQLYDLPITDSGEEAEERSLSSPSGLMAAARDREASDSKSMPDDKSEDNSEQSS